MPRAPMLLHCDMLSQGWKLPLSACAAAVSWFPIITLLICLKSHINFNSCFTYEPKSQEWVLVLKGQELLSASESL